jgi:hypothetical protein
MERVKMPVLWFSWPQDTYFPLDRLVASSDYQEGR